MEDVAVGILSGFSIGLIAFGLFLALGGVVIRHDRPIRPELSITVDAKTGIADTTYIYRKP